MHVSIIGTGYVGLVTGVCLAEMGNHVICVDNDKEKLAKLKKGIPTIYEPDLEALLKKNIKNKRLSFTGKIIDAVKNSTIIFIAVNTPPKSDGKADLSFVALVAREIATHMDSYKIIVDKSTVPVETGAKVAETIKRYNKRKIDFDVVSNPEFLREGSAVSDSLHPDRIVIGVSSPRAAKTLEDLYKPLNAPIIVTDIKSAEIIKHASNSFLATKISFINAIAQICEHAGANVEEVALGMGLDKRIGRQFLNAGIGYGGSCFPKDVAAFIKIAEDLGYDFELLKTVEKINTDQKLHFIKLIEETLWVLNDKTIAVLGLSFKPNTDDMRNAPAVDIIHALQKEGATINVYDPQAMTAAKKIVAKVRYCKTMYEAIAKTDAVLILTEWDEFKKIDLVKVRKLMINPIIIDGRNIFNPADMEKHGFIYKSIGR